MGDKKKQAHDRRVALYRKYRSKSLDQIIGQEHITKTLTNALKKNRISHAYLFTGPRGTGKTSIARILAHDINKLPYNDESEHLDIIEIDAASNRRIDDIRDLREKVKIAPISVNYKVYIIDEVHMLTSESFNALLKTLEEPPSHVIFILATTEVQKLPATIISRTQRHSFKTVPIDKVFNHLKHIAKSENIKISDEALELLAIHGNGSVRDSISLLDQVSNNTAEVDEKTVELLIGIAPKKQLNKLIESVRSGHFKNIIDTVSDLVESGINPSSIAHQLALMIRDQAIDNSINKSEIELLDKLLNVHGSVFGQLTLESTLLKAASYNSTAENTHTNNKPEGSMAESKNSQPVKSNTIATNVSSPKIQEEEIESNTSKEIIKTKPRAKSIPNDFKVTEIWGDVLTEVKNLNNSLYTVLRLAQCSNKSNEITLKFSFPFHKKRVDETKNLKILSQALENITGYELLIVTIIEENVVPTIELESKNKNNSNNYAHASVIDSVRDIMGGGEIVNV